MKILYLHGFASAPSSRKAQFLAGMLRHEGYQVEIPELEQGDFFHLTLSSQLRVIEQAAAGEPVYLIGSSLGGYLAALYASRQVEQVQRAVMLAPAFWFVQGWPQQMGAEAWRSWQTEGQREFFHYAHNEPRLLSYDLIRDAEQYPPDPPMSQPGLIIHGVQDPVVPVEASRQFVKTKPNVRLIEVESGHELTDQLDLIARETIAFLG